MENDFLDFDDLENEAGPLDLENDFNDMMFNNNDILGLTPEETNEAINEMLDAMANGEFDDILNTDDFDTGEGWLEKTGSL